MADCSSLLRDIGKSIFASYSQLKAPADIGKTKTGCKHYIGLDSNLLNDIVYVRSAADGLWLKFLHHDTEHEKTTQFWKLASLYGEDYDLKLSAIHRFVLGLSSVPLEAQLESDASAINNPDWHGRTPLIWAAMRDDCEKLKISISEGVDISCCDNERRTALHMACIANCHSCVLKILAAGADPDFHDSWGHAAMHFVTSSDSDDITETERTILVLKDYGAQLDVLDNGGWTPLYDAVDRDSLAVVSLLLSNSPRLRPLRIIEPVERPMTGWTMSWHDQHGWASPTRQSLHPYR
jgi:hypothetical protein